MKTILMLGTDLACACILKEPCPFEEMLAIVDCFKIFEASAERIDYFRDRIIERGDDPQSVAIVVISADDPLGKPLLDILMPNYDWQSYRDRGEKPIGQGIVDRRILADYLHDMVDIDAVSPLSDFQGVPVVVIDFLMAVMFKEDGDILHQSSFLSQES